MRLTILWGSSEKSVNTVECLPEVSEVDIQYRSTFRSRHCLMEIHWCNPCLYFTGYWEKSYSSPVVTVAEVTFHCQLADKPLLQSFGMTLCSHILAKRPVSTVATVVVSGFSNSVWMESILTALALFIALIAGVTSAWVSGLVSISTISSTVSGWVGLFWTHLTACSYSVAMIFPCLSLT